MGVSIPLPLFFLKGMFYMPTKNEFTAHDIYAIALTLLAEKEARAKDYNEFYPNDLNVVLAECFDANNSLRISQGKKPFEKEEMPFIKPEDIDEIIPYDIQLIRECMVFGLAAYLVLDDDKSIASAFSQQYESKLRKFAVANTENIEDVY